MLLKVNDLVKYWFDTGARGMAFCYGIVEKAGPKVFTVRWESGIRNRVRQDNKDVTLITDPEMRAEAARQLQSSLVMSSVRRPAQR